MSEMAQKLDRAVREEFGRQKFHASAGPGIYGTAIPPIDTRAIVRAVLIALLEPTEAMTAAAYDALDTYDYLSERGSHPCTVAHAHRAMIDAALKG